MIDRSSQRHDPVMMQEVVEYLAPQPGAVIVDGTLGMGGHARAILTKVGQTGRLVGIDRDNNSIIKAKSNLTEFAGQCDFIHADFRDIDKVLLDLNIKMVDGILLDLGISSYQLDDPSRGFTFNETGPLDMRMDQSNAYSAYDLVNSMSEKELSTIIRDYGEERWHNRVAKALVYHRSKKPIQSTEELSHIIIKAVPYSKTRYRIHPATRTFQAIRIAVNKELEALESALDKCLGLLKVTGRLVVIAFHSLEDRIVKVKFRDWAGQGLAKVLLKKPLRPQEAEINHNLRSRSARLRAIERLR